MLVRPLLPSLLLAVGPCQALLEKRQSASTTTTTSSVFVAPTASAAPNINSSYYDISQHFCRIYRHASVYADGKIYIDGGNTYVPKGNGSFNDTPSGAFTKGMNNNLVVLDLSRNFTNQDTFPYSALHKGPDVPSSLIEHTLWYSRATRKVYQLGGWFSFNNVNDPGYKPLSAIPEAAIWEFDIDGQAWSMAADLAVVNTGNKTDRPGAAANCDAPSLNMSFVFEGYVQQRSDQDYINFTQSSQFKFLEGMLSLDASTAVAKPTLTNISVPQQMAGQDFGPRMNGAMVHVPVGEYGVVVQIGGQTTVNPTPYGQAIANANAGNTNIPLSFVDIYDIESGYWFRQQTFGLSDGIPTGRSDICTAMVPAKDSSSLNIYMVAGVETYQSFLTSEEIWVLTIPTFQWTLVHSRADGMYGHTCHAVGENLLIIGGMTNGGDVTTCSEHMPAEIYSLAAENYTGRFDADGAKRTAPVPSKVVAAIGGTSDGGAYITSPKLWSDLYLQYVFNPTLTRPAYTPAYVLANATNSNATAPSSGPDRSVVIGASVGVAVGALLLASLAVGFCLMRRHKKKKAAAAAADEVAAQDVYRQSVMSQHSELPAYNREVKHESGPVFRGVPSLSVSQAYGPAELGTDADRTYLASSTVPSSPDPRYSVGLSEMGSPPLDGGTQLYACSEMGSSEAGHGHSRNRSQSQGQGQQTVPPSAGFPPSSDAPHYHQHRSISPQRQQLEENDEVNYQDFRLSDQSHDPHPSPDLGRAA